MSLGGYRTIVADTLDEIERVSPAPRLEMFARRQRLGWDTWGHEALDHVGLSK